MCIFCLIMKNQQTIYAIFGIVTLPKPPAPLVLQPLTHKLTDRRIQI